MRLAFLGTPDFAVAALAKLVEAGHDIAAVYSQPPAPRGRGQALKPSPVHAFAEARDIGLALTVVLGGVLLASVALVVRASGLGIGQTVFVYRDTVPCTTAGPRMQQAGWLDQTHPATRVGPHSPSTKCYRVLVLNFSKSVTADVSVVLSTPYVKSLSPTEGKNDGGYSITISGYGFGETLGQVHLAGFPLTVTRWTDTSVTVTMFNAGTMLGDLELKVTTAEGASSNAVTFTLVD
jgi:hypothetical protein